MTIAKCHVCHVEDDLQNLTKVSNGNKELHAHERCIDQHNKDVERNLRALNVSMTAGEVLDHDIDPDNWYRVETFLRQKNPKVGKLFIADVVEAARERRNENRLHGLFEIIRDETPAWPNDNKIIAKLAADIHDEVVTELRGMAAADNASWYSKGEIEISAARYAARLLIKHAAWRKYEDGLEEINRRALEETEEVEDAF